MQVTVSRKGLLAEGDSGREELVTLDDRATTTDVLAACALDPRRCIVVRNGVAMQRAAPLADGDRLQLYPAQAGG